MKLRAIIGLIWVLLGVTAYVLHTYADKHQPPPVVVKPVNNAAYGPRAPLPPLAPIVTTVMPEWVTAVEKSVEAAKPVVINKRAVAPAKKAAKKKTVKRVAKRPVKALTGGEERITLLVKPFWN